MQTVAPGVKKETPDFRVALSLDAINFLLADVRGAVGPYLNVFLVTEQHWSQTNVGFVTLVSGILGLIAQTPIGAGIDATRAKRGVIVISLAMLAIGAFIIFFMPTYYPVLFACSLMAIVGDVFGPAVAALTLGLYPRAAIAKRFGRNSAMDHAGNVAIAIAAGAVGYALGQRFVFLLVPAFAILACIATLSVPAKAIDHDRASGLNHADDGDAGDGDTEGGDHGAKAGEKVEVVGSSKQRFVPNKNLIILSICMMLFHFANAPLLPLVGQKLAAIQPKFATAMMSSCIIAAQCVMLPIALIVGNTADKFGRKPISLIGFGILPLRSILYLFSNDPAWLIGVQLLDGVGAGIFGALLPLAIADLMRGTPHYNVAQGFVATVQGLGACVSGLVAGWLVDKFGYNAAFLFAGACAAIAFVVYAVAMPETKQADYS